MKRDAIKALPIEVAAACGYVPGFNLPRWKVWWNRILLRISPMPPRIKVWTSKGDVPPMQPGIWHREAPGGVIGSAETQAKLFAHQIEIERVLAQDVGEANQFWRDYDAKATEVVMSGTTVVAVTGTYVPRVVSGSNT